MEIKKSHLYWGIGISLTGLGLALYLSRHLIYKKFDYKTNIRLLTLEPAFRKKVVRLIRNAKKKGIELRVISAQRDCEEQNKLYAKGRKGIPGEIIVTNAKCGQSAHNYKKAVDLVEYKNGKFLWKNQNWNLIGKLGEVEGLDWGGRWKFVDKPHFQKLDRRVSELYAQYKRTGKLAA